ncbi:hypothetical protein BGX38DRAFT_1183097 [Terfezia claveryi]|nr:hypothetical protein BGX38DRAFT_1245292 [Terfezia claveryi]KAF8433851.1 hypothetical protein BGX38DRAFT_1221706 [Terfezia claveryi]KAF8451389.1 hypothetical protein BGX38DRAFT_1183097 [Terfezia claveryi]
MALYQQAVSELQGVKLAGFLEEFSDCIILMDDKIGQSATIHKAYLDSLSATTCEEMGLSIPALHEKVRYDLINDMHVKSMALESRRRNHRKRLNEIWGPGWELTLSGLLPADLTEGFLCRLARFANLIGNPSDWQEIRRGLHSIIDTRIRQPKASKVPNLQTIDLTRFMSTYKPADKVSCSAENNVNPMEPPSDVMSNPDVIMADAREEVVTEEVVTSVTSVPNNVAGSSPTSAIQLAGQADNNLPKERAFAIVVSKKRKNILSPAFSRSQNPKRQQVGNKCPRKPSTIPLANPNRLLVEEKMDKLKKEAEESFDAYKQKNIQLASEAVAVVMGGQDKDDLPIAREEIVERLQLMFDLLEISPVLQKDSEDSCHANSNNTDSDKEAQGSDHEAEGTDNEDDRSDDEDEGSENEDDGSGNDDGSGTDDEAEGSDNN